MKQHIKQYPAKRGFACGGAVKKRGMVDGGVAGRNYPVSLSDSIPAASASGMAALASVANSPAQTAAPPGAPLASVRQFGDFSSQQAQQAGADIPAAAPGSSLGPADQFSWRVMPKTDATQQPAAPQSAQQTMAISAPAATPLLTMAEKDRAAGHNPNGPYRYDQMGNKQWIGETKQTQVANANQFAESVGQPAKTMPFTDQLGETIASSARRARRPVFADGGAVKETPEQMLARMGSKYGLGDTGKGTTQQPTPQAPQPAPAPTQQPVAQGGMMGKTTDAIGRRNDELRRVSNYGDGGMVSRVKDLSRGAAQAIGEFLNVGKPNETVVKQPEARYNDNQILVPREEGRADMPQERKQSFMAETARRGQQMREAMNYGDGGMVRFAGKGGPRDDKIPVKVAGESINVSDGENAVILPAKTAANPQAVGLIGQIIQATNDGRAPNMGISEGGRYQKGSYPYTDEPVPTAQQVYAPVAQGIATQAFPSTAKVVQEYGDKAQKAADQGNYGGALGHVARGGVEGVYGVADDVMRSAAYALDPAANALKTFVTAAKTAANPQAVGLIGQIIQQSNDGRAPKMGMADGGRYARGANALTPAELAAQIYQEQTGQQAPTGANPAPATRGATGVFQSGSTASFQAPQPGQVSAQATGRTDPGKYPYTGQAAQNPYQDASLAGAVDAVTPTNHLASHPIYSGVSLGGMIDAVTSSGGAQQAAPSQQTKIVAQPAPGGGMAAVATQPKPQATQQAAHAKGVLDWLPEGGVLRPENRQEFGQKFAEISERGMAGRGILTGKPAAQAAPAQKAAPQQAQATYSNEGRQSAVQAASMDAQTADPSIAATTGNSGARVMPSGAIEVNMGRGFDPTKLAMAPGSGMVSDATGRTMVVTNMGPNQYTAADGTKNARWEQTQAYIDAQNRLQADKLRVAEMQAIRQGMNPVQAAAATQGMAQAAQRAPLDRQVVQQQIETGKVAAQNSRELQDLYAAHKSAATADEQERIAEQIRIRIGKDKPEEFAHAAGGTTINPSTMGVEKTPDVIYSKRTGKTPGATPAAAKTFSKSDVDAAISAGASKEAVAARIKSMGMNPKDYGL